MSLVSADDIYGRSIRGMPSGTVGNSPSIIAGWVARENEVDPIGTNDSLPSDKSLGSAQRLGCTNRMKANHLILTFFAFLLLFASMSGQEQPKAVLVDEFGELCSDDLRSRIDSFFATISNSPGSTGYVVGLAQSSLPGRYEKFLRLFKNQLSFRNFYPDRVRFLRSSDRDDLRIQFWLVPVGGSLPDVPAYVRSPILVPTLFDASAIDSIEKGEVLFGEGGEPCDFGLQPEHFANELNKQPNLEAHLVATSDRRHSARFVKRALRLTQQALTKTYGIPAGRIKISYAGTAEESEMQLWVVPHGSIRPRRFTSRIPD